MSDDLSKRDSGPESSPTDMASGHEMSDVSIPALAAFLGALLVSLAIVVFAIAWIFGVLANQAERHDRPEAALAKLRSEKPPAPRLQQSPAFDMRALRAKQQQMLDRAEWVDKQAGVLRLPIEQAIRLIARPEQPEKNGSGSRTEQTKQGLPKWPRVEVEKTGDEDVARKKKAEPPGTGKNPDAKSRETVPEKQPSDLPSSKTGAGKSEDQK